ncbi:indole-3-acetic acid-induced protein ARG7 [Brachypodium distachyon]|uniref:Uncharacterized protein n=1 Tax=Brachypodium distachyon TaxID=15368 RepID=I1IRM5_BRADI|nr:indole-3-acetic acid-induced protein ARG7 [Brachypodium distachyon]KQJ90942.1 hypothetical protein BRADI_4g34760v3 [Brachypodium distachyon]|eukprot:XP_003576721.1 indole-3-acetic acid-induced protein ARG7 [Brachypodium distachyon]
MGIAEKRPATEVRGRKAGGLITKTLERCRSTPTARQKPAEGCFSVYVGAGRQRFVVRTECVNHPLFVALLEEAEEVFGYAATGPLQLPCNAEAFTGVLEQIREEKQAAACRKAAAGKGCGLARGQSAYRLLGTGGRLVHIGRS